MQPTNGGGFGRLLLCDGPSAEIPASDRIYDFLIGSWRLEVRDRLDDGTVRTAAGEVHAAWVLEGRAVQDLWISPRVAERTASTPKPGNRYGTTLRVYDPAVRAWRVTWTNPVTGVQSALVGRREGNRIVQEGRDDQDRWMRWSFEGIDRPTIHWTGEISTDSGVTWKLQTEFMLHRIGA